MDAVLLEKDGPIGRLILNRPEKHNALRFADLDDLVGLLHEAEEDDDIRVIVLQGRGPSFCSGHDYNDAVASYGLEAGDDGSKPRRPTTGKLIRRPEDCLVLIRDRLPTYITRDRFQANQKRLDANRARHDRLGAPRQGASLLSGLIRCGRCGQRMAVRYAGPKNRHSYNCMRGTSTYAEPLCQSLSGPVLDDLIARRVLAAVEPAALEASLAAVAGVERERSELARHWHLRRERAAHEVDRACRQYQAPEPENRLVGRELERRWEEALKSQRHLEEEFERWQRTVPGRLSGADEQAIRSLAADLPAVWRAATTTPAEQQRIVRLLMEHVKVQVDKSSERVDVELRWVGRLVESHTLLRPVNRYDMKADYPRLVERLQVWSAEGRSAAAIAESLNTEGFHPPKRARRFTGQMVQRLLWHLKLGRREPHGSLAGLSADEYRPGSLARHLGISRDTIRSWVRLGWVTARCDTQGHHIIWADETELVRLGELHQLRRTWETKERFAELTKPKARPEQ